MECQNCKLLEAVVDELTDEIARLRGRRRTLFTTLRLLRQTIIRQMEQEHAEQEFTASAGDDGVGRITEPVENAGGSFLSSRQVGQPADDTASTESDRLQ